MFVVIAGPLGVGKTTVAKKVATSLGGRYFSIDEILLEYGLDRHENGDAGIPLNNFLQANAILQPEIDAVVNSGHAAIVDGCFYHSEALDDLLKTIPSPHYVFTMIAPLEVCIARDRKRQKPLGADAAKAVYSLCADLHHGTTLDATQPIEKNTATIIQLVTKEFTKA